MRRTHDRFPLPHSADTSPSYLTRWLERWDQIHKADTFYAVDVVALLSWGFDARIPEGNSDSKEERATQKRLEQRQVAIYASLIAGMNYDPGSDYGKRDDHRLYWGSRGKVEREALRVVNENIFKPVYDYVVRQSRNRLSKKKLSDHEKLLLLAERLQVGRIIESCLSDDAVRYLLHFFDPAYDNHRFWWKNTVPESQSDEDKAATVFFRVLLAHLWSPYAERYLSREVLAYARRTTLGWFKRLPYRRNMFFRSSSLTSWERLEKTRMGKSPHLHLLARMRKARPQKRPKLRRITRGALLRINRKVVIVQPTIKKLWRK